METRAISGSSNALSAPRLPGTSPVGPAAAGAPGLASVRWVFVYIAVEIICQLCLLSAQLAPARVVFRSAAFGLSLLLLLALPGRSPIQHPARPVVLAVIAVLTLSIANPMGSTVIAVVAHYFFHLAILAPIFWVARLDVKPATIRQVLLVLWVYSSASAVLGVLQAYFPGQFQPSISTLIAREKIMAIKLASGVWVPRPMGLTDVPGGAASSGLYATLLGLGVIFAAPFRFARTAGALSMIVGVICIYLCQIRAMVVMLAVCSIVLITLFAISGRVPRMAAAGVLVGIIALAGFYLATELGGESVTTRLATLVQDDPATVYQRNRGYFVEKAFVTLLPEYPLGAGFGRWGMMNQYFGNPEDLIWSEVQWTGWVLDGGLFLVIAYPLAVGLMVWVAARIALDRSSAENSLWAGIVAAYGVGTIALTFSYSVFMSTGGLDFWLINSVLFYGISRARTALPEPRAHPS
jgi:hypothetical protein